MVSNVTGHNLPTLRTFLNCLPSSQNDDRYVVDAPFEFQISDVFSVPFVGTVVVSGLYRGGVKLIRRAASLRQALSTVSC